MAQQLQTTQDYTTRQKKHERPQHNQKGSRAKTFIIKQIQSLEVIALHYVLPSFLLGQRACSLGSSLNLLRGHVLVRLIERYELPLPTCGVHIHSLRGVDTEISFAFLGIGSLFSLLARPSLSAREYCHTSPGTLGRRVPVRH